MSLFKSQLHQEIWIEHHCHRCFHHNGSGCAIVQKALKSNRKPVEWERNTRKNVTMAETIRCHSETRQPPTLARPTVDIDVPMFDVESSDVAMDSDHA